MMFNSCLSVRRLSVSRGGVSILNEINLSVGPGEVVILRGPNGVGKTTLLKALAGLISPDDGEILYAKKIEPREDADFNEATYCGPVNAVKKSLTVRENIRFWTGLYKAQPNDGDNAISELKLGAYADYPTGALSTGYTRRLGLARLLIAKRAIWLVDEPTASLDDDSAQTFVQIVESHRAAGGAAIIATHDAIPVENARQMTLSLSESAI